MLRRAGISRHRLFAALVMLVGICACARAASPSDVHPLIAYVQAPDASYAWSKEGERKLPSGGTCVRVNMTSQTWQGIPWKHELDIIRPKKVRYPATMLMFIAGGHADTDLVNAVGRAADAGGVPIAALFDIPNQPLFDGRNEDALIAYTFVRFLETGDKTWPLLYPMTKSAVRAMDTIQKIAADDWKSPVKGFVISGASKRGWTTWFTGAVDKRVVGIAPAVYDNLNLAAQMQQQTACYGKYSAMISDYTEKGLPQLLCTDEGKEFARMVDPYTLLDRLTMPKIILLGSNDPYWTLESANLYYADLPGDKHIVYAPNAGHVYIQEPKIGDALTAFTLTCAAGRELPKMTWDYADQPDGVQLTLRPGKVSAVRVWTAASDTRDFRNAKWTDQRITGKKGEYAFTLPDPKNGFAAVFGEASYRGRTPFAQSTTPRILQAK